MRIGEELQVSVGVWMFHEYVANLCFSLYRPRLETPPW